MPEVLLFVSALLASWMFWLSSGRNRIVLYILLFWIGLQSSLAVKGYFLDTTSLPPPQAVMIAPPVLLLIGLLLTSMGRSFLKRLNLKLLTLLHLVRVPVEIMLWMLFMQKLIPVDLTFEGVNFDIVMGLSAPVVVYFFFVKKKMSKTALVAWNILSIVLLLNVVVRGILSVPSPFQAIGFDQPNIAMLRFPFNFLPALIVPLVLYSSVAALLQLKSKSVPNALQ